MKQLSGIILFALLISLPSCRVLYPNLMFQQRQYQYFELAQKQIDQYVIQAGDEITIATYARDGFRLIDIMSTTGSVGSGSGLPYLVDNEGFVRLPVIGELFVKGYTEKELGRILADKFAGLFVDPFVVLKVINKRAFLFRGALGGIITLNDAPTNIFEVIAKSGGLSNNLKAYNIKIIRGDIKNPQIIMVDLSTLEGMRRSNLIIQSNDIIYIDEKRVPITSQILSEIYPYLGFVTTVVSLVLLAKSYGK